MITSKHPFEPFIPAHANRLIIGTIPPPRFCEQENFIVDDESDSDVNFYYGSRDNYFWPIVGDVFNHVFDYKKLKSSIDQRKTFLEEYGIGITDIVDSCVRIIAVRLKVEQNQLVREVGGFCC
jgi:G:T/U-mismatch repair DNA glycosylase